MWIEFLEDRVVNDFRKGTPQEEHYAAGQVIDLPEPSALHWINRQAARAVDASVVNKQQLAPSAPVSGPPPSSTAEDDDLSHNPHTSKPAVVMGSEDVGLASAKGTKRK